MTSMMDRADEQSLDQSVAPITNDSYTYQPLKPVIFVEPLGTATVTIKPVLDTAALETLMAELETAIRTALRNALGKVSTE